MNITVVGTGYVGLVSGACFAEFGNHVACVDKDPAKIEMLRAGEMPIFEPGLDGIVARNVKAGRLQFGTDIARAIRDSLVVLVAVGTPQGNDGRADLSFVFEVAQTVAHNLNGYKVVVTKSTVPAGTGRRIRSVIEEHRAEPHPFSVASNPEFLREGSAIEDFLRPNRVVLGTAGTPILEIHRRRHRHGTPGMGPAGAALDGMGGIIFFAAVALREVGPLSVTISRVLIAAILLHAFIRLTGLRMPADGRTWAAFFGMGPPNNAMPFSLIFWGQTHIASGLASILNATTPLFTVVVAHFLTSNEKLTPGRGLGVLIGLAGVVVMIGTDLLDGLNENLLAQLAVLGAAVTYASATIYGRRFRQMPPICTAAGHSAPPARS